MAPPVFQHDFVVQKIFELEFEMAMLKSARVRVVPPLAK